MKEGRTGNGERTLKERKGRLKKVVMESGRKGKIKKGNRTTVKECGWRERCPVMAE